MANHTPGPWRYATAGNMANCVEGPSGRSLYDGDDGYRNVAMVQSCCASTMHADEDANCAANIALISLAPELYEYVKGSADNGCATAIQLISKLSK